MPIANSEVSRPGSVDQFTDNAIALAWHVISSIVTIHAQSLRLQNLESFTYIGAKRQHQSFGTILPYH
jgi:hypothetical protein